MFIDKYAYRYLDSDLTDFENIYPYSSLLEVNCYALLSLDILDLLESTIDTQEAISFILSCYNPSMGGFIGQPYSSELHPFFKEATAEMTYFAVKTLNILGYSWSSGEIDEIVDFIESLQSLVSGGFYNNYTEDDATYYVKTNLLYSYYCLKTLETFSYEDSIETDEFYLFLDGLYDNEENYFKMSISITDTGFCEIPATGLGLQTAEITEYSNYDRNGVISFLMLNRNAWGIWDNSRSYPYHELIDTFQVLRSLSEVGEVNQLSSSDKDQIASALKYYKQYNGGYALLSNDYMSLSLLYTIAESFWLFDRLSDFDFQEIYDMIEHSYLNNRKSFTSSVGLNASKTIFRSHPIEYYTSSKNVLFKDIGEIYSHESTFYALDTLEKIHMFDNFMSSHDLTEVLDAIIDSQFINPSYDNSGAFLPSYLYKLEELEFQNNNIFLQYSFYAIKTLELLTNGLSMGPITDLNFDKNALYTYMFEKSPNSIFIDPRFSNDIETILQNTYYMIYILNALDMYNLDDQKIKSFVIQNLDYSNIKNIYYSYKIIKILNLDISFDFELTQALIQDIYNDTLYEFYRTTDKNEIEQEIILWITDMAKNDPIKIKAYFPKSVYAGNSINITVTIGNIALDEFGDYIVVKFETEYKPIEDIVLNRLSNGSYSKDIEIPAEFTESKIDANITVYDVNEVVSVQAITIDIILATITSSESTSSKDSGAIRDPEYEESYQSAIPIMLGVIFIPVMMMVIASKRGRKLKSRVISN